MNLNSSPAICCGPPMPAEAMFSLPGLGLAYAMNSGTVLAGTEGCHSMTTGTLSTLPNGAMARCKVETELLIEGDVDRVLRVHQQQRIAVRRHVSHRFGCDVTGGARPDLDDELLAKLF